MSSLTKPTSSQVLQDISSLSAAAVLVVPAGGPGISFQRPLWEQRLHGQRLLLHPNRPGIPRQYHRTPYMKWLQKLAFDNRAFQGAATFPAEIQILLVEASFVEKVQKVMGVPTFVDQRFAAWDLRER